MRGCARRPAKSSGRRYHLCEVLSLPTDPQIYQQLQGDSEGMFDVTAGILLDKIQQKAYDTLKWSLYLKVCTTLFSVLRPI